MGGGLCSAVQQAHASPEAFHLGGVDITYSAHREVMTPTWTVPLQSEPGLHALPHGEPGGFTVPSEMSAAALCLNRVRDEKRSYKTLTLPVKMTASRDALTRHSNNNTRTEAGAAEFLFQAVTPF